MQPGDIIDERFEIQALAAQGGMALLWRGLDHVRGRPVAVKTTRPDLPNLRTRFAQEIEVLALLDHPGIVQYVAHGVTTDDSPYLVMEWLEGRDLAARLASGALNPEQAVALASRVAEALHHAHVAGLVHRDLKPANIWLLDDDPTRVKVLDFGVARTALSLADLMQSAGHTLLGTPGYMSPEQARGRGDVDARSDVYALGCVLFQCLAGRPAFVAAHPLALLAKVLVEEAPRVSEWVRVSGELDDLVFRMMAKEPTTRPLDMQEVVRAVSALPALDQRCDEPTPSTPLMREQQWVCVLLVDEGPASVVEQTWATEEVDAQRLALARVAELTGARVEYIANTARLLLWQGDGSPAETAARAARVALTMRERLPGAGLALACGRAALSGRQVVGDALDRAAAHVRSGPGVATDHAFAKLVSRGFEITPATDGATVWAERSHAPLVGALLGSHSPCVGREPELALLDEVLRRCCGQSRAEVVVLAGDIGAGKSRLAADWLARVLREQPEVQVWHVQGDVTQREVAYGLAACCVRLACGLAPLTDRAIAQAAIAAQVAEVVPAADRQRIASRLCELCGVPWTSDVDAALQSARRDAGLMGDQLRTAWEDFVVASCARRPLLLVLDDAQWADEASMALLSRVLGNFSDVAWMVLGLTRDAEAIGLKSLPRDRLCLQTLPPLASEASALVVRTALASAPEATVVRIVERAAGNAALLEELIRAEEAGLGDDPPDTVLAMVEARLLRLAPELRRVLRAAAVFGVRFMAEGVAHLLNDAEVAERLAELTAAEWLTRWEAGEFGFRSGTTRDAAYAMLVADDRRLAHEQAAHWLAAGDGAAPAVVAAHFDRASRPQLAGPLWVQAGEEQLRAAALTDALAAAERALACQVTGDDRARALLVAAKAHGFLGAPEAALASELEAARTAEANQDLKASAVACVVVSAGKLGDEALMTESLRTMEAYLDQHPSNDLLVNAWKVAAQTVARNPETVALAARLLQRTKRLLEQRREPLLPHQLARLAYSKACEGFQNGSIATVLRNGVEAHAACQEAGDIRMAVAIGCDLAFAELLVGAQADTVERLTTVIAAAQRASMALVVLVARQNLGLALSRLGRHAEALRVLQQAVADAPRVAGPVWTAACSAYLARAQLAAGQVQDALATANQVPQLAGFGREKTLLAQLTLADALLTRAGADDRSLALAHTRTAMAELDCFSERSLPWCVHLDALSATGAPDYAQAVAAAADWVETQRTDLAGTAYLTSFEQQEPNVVRILRHVRATANAGHAVEQH